jgi:hypothetical protein
LIKSHCVLDALWKARVWNMEENYLPCCFCCLPLLPPLHFVVGLCTLRRLSFSSTHSHTATTIKRAHPPCFFLNNDSTTDRLDVIFDQRFFSTKFICVYIKNIAQRGISKTLHWHYLFW